MIKLKNIVKPNSFYRKVCDVIGIDGMH